MALTPRTAGRFYLELDRLPCGFLRSVEGGSVKAEVVTAPPGAVVADLYCERMELAL